MSTMIGRGNGGQSRVQGIKRTCLQARAKFSSENGRQSLPAFDFLFGETASLLSWSVVENFQVMFLKWAGVDTLSYRRRRESLHLVASGVCPYI